MKPKPSPAALALLLILLCAPASGSGMGAVPQAPAPAQTSTISAKPPTPCGFNTNDWCPAPTGDACGAHRDAASCKADARCQGVHYRGESVVECHYDKRGFADNCPTVGCVSR